MSRGVERVRTILDEHGLGHRVVRLEARTHTAREAAEALGVEVAQIAKSIVFQASSSGRPVVVITRGDRRVDEKSLEVWLEEPLQRATPTDSAVLTHVLPSSNWSRPTNFGR